MEGVLPKRPMFSLRWGKVMNLGPGFKARVVVKNKNSSKSGIISILILLLLVT